MNEPTLPDTPHPSTSRRTRFHSYKSRVNLKRSVAEKFADLLTSSFGTFGFLLVNILLFVVWILVNSGKFANITPFDPFPYTFLTMIVSLEAIILSIIVLMSENREAKISDIRSEIDTRIDIVAEEEITKILVLLSKLLEKNGIDVSKDEELQKMLTPVDKGYLEKKFEKEV